MCAKCVAHKAVVLVENDYKGFIVFFIYLHHTVGDSFVLHKPYLGILFMKFVAYLFLKVFEHFIFIIGVLILARNIYRNEIQFV